MDCVETRHERRDTIRRRTLSANQIPCATFGRAPTQSGNPAVVGPCGPVRPVTLRPRLSHGCAMKQTGKTCFLYDKRIIAAGKSPSQGESCQKTGCYGQIFHTGADRASGRQGPRQAAKRQRAEDAPPVVVGIASDPTDSGTSLWRTPSGCHRQCRAQRVGGKALAGDRYRASAWQEKQKRPSTRRPSSGHRRKGAPAPTSPGQPTRPPKGWTKCGVQMAFGDVSLRCRRVRPAGLPPAWRRLLSRDVHVVAGGGPHGHVRGHHGAVPGAHEAHRGGPACGAGCGAGGSAGGGTGGGVTGGGVPSSPT